jgi:GntR family transcriptional regulator/MocR family aminotransferase
MLAQLVPEERGILPPQKEQARDVKCAFWVKRVSPRPIHARDLLVHIDRSGVPGVGRQLEAQIREAIRAGRLAPGSDLPSGRALAEDLAVSRGVVVRAYAQLAAEGYLDLRQGASPRVRRIPHPGPASRVSAAAERTAKLRYDLRPHQPELSTFPRQAWLRSLRHILTTAADAAFGYIDRRGLEQLREEISQYLGRARGVAADPDRIVVTAGSTQTLSLIARALARDGARTIGFENPSHRLLYEVARRAGVTPVGIQVDGDGLRVDELESAGVPAVVVTPAHQFPTGVVLSAERRGELVRWARESGGLIVEDDYDAEFRYDRAPIGAFQGLSQEQVAYLGSTGKTLSPGIRIGWVVLPEDLVETVAAELQTSVLHVSGIDQLALADFVRRGEFDRHLRRMRTLYRSRRDALVRALETRLPRLQVSGIAAGLHVVVELPSAAAEAAARKQAQARGLALATISENTLPGYAGPPGLLIGYGRIAEPAIPLAVDELAQALGARARSGAHTLRRGSGRQASRRASPAGAAEASGSASPSLVPEHQSTKAPRP